MTRLPAVKPRKVIRALERAGFYIHHIKGSHHYLKHPDDLTLLVCVAVHSKEMKRGTLAAVLASARLTIEQLNDLL